MINIYIICIMWTMRLYEILESTQLNEGKSHPIICVDVQPEYANFGNNKRKCEEIINFVTSSTGPVLMFVNAEETGVSSDTIYDVKQYWEETVGYEYDEENDEYIEPIDWSRYKIVDKGFGYLRPWMDEGVDDASIIKTIRALYQYKFSDSRQLIDVNGQNILQDMLGENYRDWMEDMPISVEWISVTLLKQFNGAYIVGGGKDQCLREVELIMNAFNIKYKRISSLVY